MRKRLRDVESHFGSVNAWKVREAWVPYSLTGFLWSNLVRQVICSWMACFLLWGDPKLCWLQLYLGHFRHSRPDVSAHLPDTPWSPAERNLFVDLLLSSRPRLGGSFDDILWSFVAVGNECLTLPYSILKVAGWHQCLIDWMTEGMADRVTD